MSEWTNLKIPGKAGSTQLTDQIRSNMQGFLDWALLNQGWYMNVSLDTVYPNGGIPSKLRPSDDIRYPSGIVWDGFKTNWIWEQNIESPNQPINISGLYINNVFLPVNSGYNINYPLGRIVFDTPQDITKTVQAEFSFKYYNVYPDTVPWFKKLTEGTWRVDDTQYSTSGSGIWSIMPEVRSQLPAVVVEVSPKVKNTAIGLGGGQWVEKDVLFHVLSENSFDRDSLTDILSYQWEKTLYLYDLNEMRQSGIFPLNQYGYLVNPSSTYPFLIDQYYGRYAYVDKINGQKSDNAPQSIFHGIVRWTLKVAMPDIL